MTKVSTAAVCRALGTKAPSPLRGSALLFSSLPARITAEWTSGDSLHGTSSLRYQIPARAGQDMKQLTIVVKPFCVAAVLRAIADLGLTACVAREAKGYSRQKGYLDRYVGSEYSMAFLPKVEIGVWVGDDRIEEVTDRIVRTARTGRMGDGKIFVLPTAWPDALEF
jgi:nitrogen regulatory protein PII